MSPKRTKVSPVIVSSHAQDRYRERGGAGRLSAGAIRRRLLIALKAGLPAGPGVSVRVPVDHRLAAVLVPNSGQEPPGYTVVTVEVMHDEDRTGQVDAQETLPGA